MELAAAGAVVLWLLFLSQRYVFAAVDKLQVGGPIGRGEGSDAFRVFLFAGGAAVFAALFGIDIRHVFTRGLLAVATVVCLALGYLTGALAAVLAVTFLLAFATFLGEASLRLLRVGTGTLGGWGRLAIAPAIGLGLLSHSLLLLGLIGLFSDAGLALLFAAWTVVAGGALYYRRSAGDEEMDAAAPAVEEVTKEELFVEYAALGLMVVFLVAAFGASLAPQTSFDALMYHLSMPLIFLDAGSYVQRYDIQGSQLPLGTEMLFVPAMRLGGETAANLLTWSFVPLTAGLFWSAGNRFFGRPVGALTAFLFCVTPFILYESTIDSSDLSMVLYVVAGVYLTVLASKDGRPGLSLLAGLLAGLAISFKLIGAVYFVPQALVFLVATARRLRWRAPLLVRGVAPYAIGSFLGGAPWLILHWVQLGNPVYPTLNNVFKSDKWAPVNDAFGLYGVGISPRTLVSVWWTISDSPAAFSAPSTAWMIGPALLLSFAGLVWLRAGRPSGLGMFVLLALLSDLAWFLLAQHSRYGLPAYALAALPAAVAIWSSMRALSASRVFAPAVSVGLMLMWFACAVSIGLSLLTHIPKHYPQDLILGDVSRTEYREQALTTYTALKFIDKVTHENREEAVVVGLPYNRFVTARMWYFQIPQTLSPFGREINTAASPDEHARSLIDLNIRWLLVDTVSPDGATPWPPIWLTRSLLTPEFLAKHADVAFATPGATVYRVVAASEQQASPNLLCDASFDGVGGAKPCWTGSGDARVQASPVAGGDGANALVVSPAGTVSQAIPVCPGALYRLTESIRSDTPSSFARMQIIWLDAAGKNVSAALRAEPVTPDWADSQLAATAPEGVASARVIVTAGAGQVWFDNVRLQNLVGQYSPACDRH